VRGFYAGLSASMDHMVAEGFVKKNQRDQVWFGASIDALFDWMKHYESSYTPKWITSDAV
jgi:predicted Rossmann-fold nucleotide-binding protein